MKITITIKDLIYVIIIGSLLFFLFKKDVQKPIEQVSGLTGELDSIYKVEGLKHKIVSDSMITLVLVKEKEIIRLNKEIISIKSNGKDERAKVKKLPDPVRDSILNQLLISKGIRGQNMLQR